jgi:hypothetical protein
MATLFAPSKLLTAYAYAEDGSDANLPRGTHLRLFAGHGDSFPLAPFVVFRLNSRASEPFAMHVLDAAGQPHPQGLDLSDIGVADAILTLRDDDQRRTVRLDLMPSQADGIEHAWLFDQNEHVIAHRTAPPWRFAAPVFHRLRLRGRDRFIPLRTRIVQISDLIGERQPDPVAVLGLPIEGEHAWYLGGQGRAAALDRVARGAPLQLNVADRPLGPFDQLGPGDELARIEAMLGAVQLGGGLESILARLVDDTSAPPWAQVDKQDLTPAGVRRQTASSGRLAALQFAALDPGLARFLGFADCIEDLPDLEGAGWDTLAVVGLFACAPQEPSIDGDVAGEDSLFELFAHGLEALGAGRDMAGPLHRAIQRARRAGLVLRTVVCPVAPVPPWNPPDLPSPQIVDLRWQPAVGDTPSDRYRAGLVFDHRSQTTLAAVSARLDGAWTPRHATLPVANAQPESRSQPRMFGTESNPAGRVRRSGALTAAFVPAGLLAEQDLPADAAPTSIRVHASDFFGRFGAAVEFDLVPPNRPPPPPPVLRHHFEPVAVDPDAAGPIVPGHVIVTVRSEGVPRIGDLAAGSLPIATLELSLLDPPILVDLAAPADVTLPVGALGPQQTGSWQLTGIYRDAAGTPSAPALATVTATDPRPPTPYPTGVGLLWTSLPGPSPEVQLQLQWPAPKDTLHRVYLADQHGLGLSAAELAGPVAGDPSRGRIAAAGCRKVLDGRPVARESFRLLTDPPVKADASGRAVLSTLMPRSLSTVQFLRIVPLGPDGAEPAFSGCGLVAVAVPDGRRPAPPRLEGRLDPVTGVATLLVVGEGFDRVALQRDEPGLFAPNGADAGAAAPRYRVRRAVGAVVDPIYARPLADGELELADADADGARFTAEVTDDGNNSGLVPFVRHVYWAEIRLPAERRLPADLNPIDPAGGVRPLDPSGAADSPRPLSLPSAPCTLMHKPAGPPDPPQAAAITLTRQPPGADAVEVTIEIADPPRAHRLAVDRYRLAIWTQWIDGSIETAQNANGEALNGVWPSAEGGSVTITVPLPNGLPPAAPLKLRLAYADPIGRLSDITAIDVP